MMHSLEILGQNKEFLMSAYGINAMTFVFAGLLVVDVVLKGWAMWRAARLEKKVWFVMLLIVNSVGILPIIFLAMTNAQYVRLFVNTPATAKGRKTL